MPGLKLFDWTSHASPGVRASLAMPFVGALALVAIATGAGTLLAPSWGNSAVDLLYMPAVLGAAIIGGLRPALFSAVVSAIAYNFFFTAPRHTFRIDSPVDVVTVAVLLLVAIVTSQLAASVRNQARIASSHAAQNAAIAGFSRQLLSTTSEQSIAELATQQLATFFASSAVLVVGRPDAEVLASWPDRVRLTRKDLAVAEAALQSNRGEGRMPDTPRDAGWQFYPVRSKSMVIAAAGLARRDGWPPVSANQLRLIEGLLDQIALALERDRLEIEARGLAASTERDRIRSDLLSTLARDLRPGLARIAETATVLRRKTVGERSVLSTMMSEIVRLERYVSNLADLGLDTDERPLETNGVTIDLFRRSVTRNGRLVHLTPKEYAVLSELAKQPGRVLTHTYLLRSAWGPAQENRTEYLRVAVRGLRQKLERYPARPQLIINEPAVGYRLDLK